MAWKAGRREDSRAECLADGLHSLSSTTIKAHSSHGTHAPKYAQSAAARTTLPHSYRLLSFVCMYVCVCFRSPVVYACPPPARPHWLESDAGHYQARPTRVRPVLCTLEYRLVSSVCTFCELFQWNYDACIFGVFTIWHYFSVLNTFILPPFI
jgi:hypothetical protein